MNKNLLFDGSEYFDILIIAKINFFSGKKKLNQHVFYLFHEFG